MENDKANVILSKNRLEALADGLFAIVMTLLVLELSVPAIAERSVDGELLRKVLELWPKILIYMLSFLVLGSLWIHHHVTFSYITRSNGKLAWINIFLLMFVALVPFSTSLLGEYSHSRVAAAVFGLNILLIMIIALLSWMYIVGNNTLVDRAIDIEVAIRRRIMILVGVSAYTIGIGISFISPIASLYIYALAAVMSIIITWKDSHGFLSKVFVKAQKRDKKRTNK